MRNKQLSTFPDGGGKREIIIKGSNLVNKYGGVEDRRKVLQRANMLPIGVISGFCCLGQDQVYYSHNHSPD